MKIAVEGCLHGELCQVYSDIAVLEKATGEKVDVLLCCGDFQAVRDERGLKNVAVPARFRRLRDFHLFYEGVKTAPVLTVFIGGNHEDPELLSHLYYGGWVAPNMYYLGHTGVVNIAGCLRVAGISGIFKPHDFTKGYHESFPFSGSTMRSAYHIRQYEVEKLKQIVEPVDIILSHDWPRGIHQYGDTAGLRMQKRHLIEEMELNTLGNPAHMELLQHLQPRYWFAAHLHVKFAAVYTHSSQGERGEIPRTTRFLALDKVIPGRGYLEVLDIETAPPLISRCGEGTIQQTTACAAPPSSPDNIKDRQIYLEYDVEWLAILKANETTIPITGRHVQATKLVKVPTKGHFDFVKKRLEERCLTATPSSPGERRRDMYRVPDWTFPRYDNLASQRAFLQELLCIDGDLLSKIEKTDLVQPVIINRREVELAKSSVVKPPDEGVVEEFDCETGPQTYQRKEEIDIDIDELF